MRKLTTLIIIFSFSLALFAQSDSDKKEAYDKAIKAIELMDNGEIDKSIKLLDKSCKLDPENIDYPYEIGYAYYLKENYSKSIEYYEKVIKMNGANDQSFQMLGNVYDTNGQPEKAIESYKKGLEKFPASGKLYLELGNMHQDDWNIALEYYEKGIEVDPTFSSNYYWVAKIFCNSTEEVWGVLYGEIFLNIERGSERTEEISKLIFDTYLSEIKFQTDTSFSVSFSKNLVIYTDNKKVKLPYGVGVFEPCLMFSCLGESQITIESLNRIRTKFLSFYNDKEFNKAHNNILFDWHKTLIDDGNFEYYNYWLFMKGASDEFNNWHSENKENFDKFINWFSDNPLLIDKKHTFHRYEY